MTSADGCFEADDKCLAEDPVQDTALGKNQADDKCLADDHASHRGHAIDLEDVQKVLGPVGPYQLTQTIFHGSCYLPFSFLFLGFVFIGYEPEHRCLAVNESQLLEQYNLSADASPKVKYGSCHIQVFSNMTGSEKLVASLGCYNGQGYDGGKQLSMVTEWDLVCEDGGSAEFVQSVLALGTAFGMILWTSVADRFSRKYTYMVTLSTTMVSEVAFLFSQNVTTAIALRFCTGLFSGGMTLLHLVMGEEKFTTDYRQKFGGVDSIAWTVCVALLSGIAFLLRHESWRYLQTMTVALCIIPLVLSFFIDETPAWYFAKGRYEDAKRILIKACTMNGKDVDKLERLFRQCVHHEKRKIREQRKCQRKVRIETSYSVLDIFHHKKLFLMTCVLSFAWCTVSFSYYGLYLTSSVLAGNRYMNFFLMAVIDFPGLFIYIVMIVNIGRRTVLIIFFIMATCTLLTSTCLIATESASEHAANATTAFFLLGKLAVNTCFNVIIAYAPELYPTTMRSGMLGLCESLSHVGVFFAPFLLPLFRIARWAPGAITSSACAVCVALMHFLPETRGRELPITIEDVLAWDRKSPEEDRKKKRKKKDADNARRV